ncbi:MAG: MFS transporter [Planctomycetes bacterium]|nr:MFS transporter [Planctomycetota bacterium]
MTTLIVAQKSGRATICADTLTSYGGSRETARDIVNCDKLLRVGDAYLGTTGPAAMLLALTSYFRSRGARRDFSSPLAVFESAREWHAALRDDFTLNPREDPSDPFESSQTEVLICSPHGLFGVYPLRSVQQYKRFYAFGSGAEYAMGAMHAVYDYLDRPEDIAIAGLEAAASFDEGSALPYTLHSMDLVESMNPPMVPMR